MVARRLFTVALVIAAFLSFSAALWAQKYCDSEAYQDMSGVQLLTCARSTSPDDFVVWGLARSIRKKFGIRRIIAIYPKQTSAVRAVLVLALYHDHGPAVAALMRRSAGEVKPGLTAEDNQYFALEYLVKLCDPWALAQMNRAANFGHYYPVSCMQWRYTLAQFGKCGYKPAEAHLAMSLDAACVNNIVAAEQSLRQLLPASKCYKIPTSADVFQKEEACYLKAAQADLQKRTATSKH